MTKKYKLTSETTVTAWGLTLFRIEAVASFGNVDKGDKGGWIEKEENLSQEDNAWVYGNAQVSGNARVYGDAEVFGNALVYGDALVSGNARVYGDAWVYGDAQVFGNALVYGDAEVSGNAQVSGNARVYGDARVYGKIKLTLGYFFGWRHKDEKLTFIDNGDGNELIGKNDCKFEYYEEEKVEELTLAEVCKRLGKTVKIVKE